MAVFKIAFIIGIVGKRARPRVRGRRLPTHTHIHTHTQLSNGQVVLTTVVGSLGMVVGSRKMPRDAPAVPRLPWGAQSAPGPENPLKTRLVSIHKWSADFWVPIGGALLGGMFAPHRWSLGRETVPRRIVWSRPRLHADCGAAHASPNDLSTLSRLSPCPPLPFIIRAKEDTASRASARTPMHMLVTVYFYFSVHTLVTSTSTSRERRGARAAEKEDLARS